VTRILLVDDSASVRSLLSARLREHGFDVEDVEDAVRGAESALSRPPSVVVTDLWMPGVSGVQLCRLLRAEPVTAHVPVILLTASDDRRSRFWARSAGAAAYVTKSNIDTLLDELKKVTKSAETSPPAPTRAGLNGSVHERLSSLLDRALFESVIAGEVRALAQREDFPGMFADLARLCSDVVSYRWLGLALAHGGELFLHGHPNARTTTEAEARAALGTSESSSIVWLEDERPLEGRLTDSLVRPIHFGATLVGQIALGPSPRGASREDAELLQLVAGEIGGPLRMLTLMDDARRLAATDTLTGIMNRRAFIDAMSRERSRGERHGIPTSLLLLDVDHFKKVNDTKGHAAGDAVLKGVAAVLTRIARKSDIVARWGGEEFVVALTQTGETGARIAAERVRRAIAEEKMPLPEGGTLQVTASIGVASASADWALDDLVARADVAMYAAKSRGRNRVETG
jgi:two-component system cell cycle response regulator